MDPGLKTYLGIGFVTLTSLLPSLGIMYLLRSGGKPLMILFGWPFWIGGLFFGTHLLFTWDEVFFRSLNNDTVGSPVMMVPFISSFLIVPLLSSGLSSHVRRRSHR